MAENLPAIKESDKGERSVYNKVFRRWKGVFNKATRTAMPEDYWYYLENIQPIGDANAHTVPNISAAKQDYAGDTIYAASYANVNGTDYIISFATNGKVFAYNIGAGTSAQISAALSGANSQMDQWKNTFIVIIDANNYYSWDGTTFTARGGTTGAPLTGNAIAVYAGRVWIANGRSLIFSAADTLTDFQSASGGGIVSLTDPVIRTIIIRMIAANGYLYIFGRTSINVISDVYVPAGASPPVPVFTNLNVQAIIGTDMPWSVFPLNRTLMFASRFAAYGLSGVTAQKLSSDIDNTWQYIDFSQAISGGQCVINNILTAAFLIKRAGDPALPDGIVMAMWFDNRWWFTNFGNLSFIVSAFANNLPSLFGFIGNKLYQLFADPTTFPSTQFQTPLWDMGDPIRDKQAIRAGVQVHSQPNSPQVTMQLNLDTFNSSTPITQGTLGNVVSWVNNAFQTVAWQNNGLNLVTWLTNGTILFAGSSPGGFGKYIGLSGKTQNSSFEMSAAMIDYLFGKRW
jgi:hypothetical protein